MKQQIIDLWKECFGDSNEFIELFFDRVYKNENTLTIRKNNHIISALQIIPYEFSYFGTKLNAGYICGVCTSPAERGKGFMMQLMNEAILEMYRRNYSLSLLIPAEEWLFNYYHRFGFTTIFNKVEEIHKFRLKNESFTVIPVSKELSGLAYKYYDGIQQKRKCAILHSPYDFETIHIDCILDEGNVWMAQQKGGIVGLAFAIPVSKNQLFVKEIVYDRPEIKDDIIQSLLSFYGKDTAQVRIFSNGVKSQSYGMIRILNKDLLISLYKPAEFKRYAKKLFCSDSDAFTKFIFHCDQSLPYINLMLD